MERLRKNLVIIIVLIMTIGVSILCPKALMDIKVSSGDRKPIFRVSTEEKIISLTFDINWAEKEYLYDILDVLDKYNVNATFFIMGGWVNYTEENKEKVVKIKEGGHEIGNHSYIHPSFTKIDNGRILEELNKTEKIINETIGEGTKLFRFPSGDYNEKTLEFVEGLGYKCIQWDVDSVDWKQSGEAVEYERVMKKVKPGSILLFHNNAKYTPKNLEKIISNLQSDGYNLVKISELIYSEYSYVDENGVQHKK